MTGFMRLDLDFNYILNNDISETETVSNVSLIRSIERAVNLSLKLVLHIDFSLYLVIGVDCDIWTDVDASAHQSFNQWISLAVSPLDRWRFWN